MSKLLLARTNWLSIGFGLLSLGGGAAIAQTPVESEQPTQFVGYSAGAHRRGYYDAPCQTPHPAAPTTQAPTTQQPVAPTPPAAQEAPPSFFQEAGSSLGGSTVAVADPG